MNEAQIIFEKERQRIGLVLQSLVDRMEAGENPTEVLKEYSLAMKHKECNDNDCEQGINPFNCTEYFCKCNCHN